MADTPPPQIPSSFDSWPTEIPKLSPVQTEYEAWSDEEREERSVLEMLLIRCRVQVEFVNTK